MNLTFAAQLNKMITAGLGGAVEAPETGVAVGQRLEYVDIGPAPQLIFETNVEIPLRALTLYLTPVQSGSGVPSPDNVRDISGWEHANVILNTIENVYTEDLPQTVYGGTLDFVSGTLTIDRSIVSISQFRDEVAHFDKISSGGLHWANYYVPTKRGTPLIASMLESNDDGWVSTTDCIAASDEYIRIYTSADSIDALKARYPGMTICYTLANPITVQLTPLQIIPPIRRNTIWSGAGDVSASYGVIKYTEGY